MVQLSYNEEAPDKLMSLIGIGEETTTSLKMFFSNEDNVEMVNDLASQLIILPAVINTSNSPLSGKIIVFTGTLSTIEREEAQAKAENLGAKISSSVSPKTDYLIVGEKPGSKFEKAKKLSVKILTEKDFNKLIPGEKS